MTDIEKKSKAVAELLVMAEDVFGDDAAFALTTAACVAASSSGVPFDAMRARLTEGEDVIAKRAAARALGADRMQ